MIENFSQSLYEMLPHCIQLVDMLYAGRVEFWNSWFHWRVRLNTKWTSKGNHLLQVFFQLRWIRELIKLPFFFLQWGHWWSAFLKSNHLYVMSPFQADKRSEWWVLTDCWFSKALSPDLVGDIRLYPVRTYWCGYVVSSSLSLLTFFYADDLTSSCL